MFAFDSGSGGSARKADSYALELSESPFFPSLIIDQNSAKQKQVNTVVPASKVSSLPSSVQSALDSGSSKSESPVIDFTDISNALKDISTSGIKAEQDSAAAANAFSEHMWDKTAAWNSSEAEKDRLFQQGSADKAMNWEAEQAALLRSWQEGQTQKEFDFNSAEAAKDRAFQAEQAKTAMDFSERMSNTAYQRAVSDLRAAGLNPILAVSNGAASSPSGVTSSGASASGSAGSGAFGSGRSASGARASMSVPNSAKAAVSSVLSAGLSAAASKYATDIASKDKNRAIDVEFASTALQGLLSIGSAVFGALVPRTSFSYRG